MSMTGACLCGTVRWAAEAPSLSMTHCHCSMCRKHHGSLFSTYVLSALDGFRWTAGEDAVRSWRASAMFDRAFCATCGSSVPILVPQLGIAGCPAGALEGELGISPQRHVHVASMPPWCEITDELPQFEAYTANIPSIERPSVAAEPGLMLGSCLCGGMTFEADLDGAAIARNCHCSRCRRQTGAAHASNLFLRWDALRFRSGEELRTIWKLPEAERFATAFCSRCGSLAPRPIPQLERQLVPMGLLDTDPGLYPSCHIFVADKAAWFEITDELPQYAALPAS
jgi:hypothetical protein